MRPFGQYSFFIDLYKKIDLKKYIEKLIINKRIT